jgi:hypothetical protein
MMNHGLHTIKDHGLHRLRVTDYSDESLAVATQGFHGFFRSLNDHARSQQLIANSFPLFTSQTLHRICHGGFDCLETNCEQGDDHRTHYSSRKNPPRNFRPVLISL